MKNAESKLKDMKNLCRLMDVKSFFSLCSVEIEEIYYDRKYKRFYDFYIFHSKSFESSLRKQLEIDEKNIKKVTCFMG